MKRGRAHNPYENLTLHNIRTEERTKEFPMGKPLTVHSERELHAAEKKYGFVHAASAGLQDTPPQHEAGAGDITRNYRKKFNRDSSAFGPQHVKPGMAGIVGSASETLADRPTSNRRI